MNENDLQRVYIYPIYPRGSKIYTDKRFISIDDGRVGGSHWNCFIVKDKKSYYFDSFGSQPDKFLLNQLPKPIIYHIYKIQVINSQLCGSYCLYVFYLIERMNYYDVILKMYFGWKNMPINVFGNSSSNSENRIDTSLFVQKLYLRTNDIETNTKEDIDLKNQFRIKNSLDSFNIREATSKKNIDNLFNDLSIG